MQFKSHLLLVLSFLPLSLGAQSDTSKTTTIPEVQILASRVQPTSAVPHTNIQEEKIRSGAEWRDMPFMLSGVPSMVETSDAGAGVGYTGLRLRGSDATRINITLNGIPFNDAESQGVFWVNMPDIAASAAQVQVQRGVGASTNGAGAFGGSVHIDLNRLPPDPELVAQLGHGSFNTQKAMLSLHTGQRTGGWYAGARLSQIRSDGFIDRASSLLRGAHLQVGKISHRYSLTAHLLYGKERTYQAWYGLPQQYADIAAFYTFNPAGTEKPDLPYENEVDNYQQRHHLLHYKREINTKLTLQLNAHYTRGKGHYEQYKANQKLSDYGLQPVLDSVDSADLVRRLWLDNHFMGGTWLLRRTQAGNGKVEYGGGIHHYLGKHFGEVIEIPIAPQLIPSTYYSNDAQKSDANHYIRIEKPVGRARLSVDVQHRFVAYQFFGPDRNGIYLNDRVKLHFFNPKLSAVWPLKNHHQIYAFAGVAHREPNRDDYTNSSPTSRPKPERLYNLETGWKKSQGKLTTQINLFAMYYRNQLVLNGQINDVGAYTRVNVPQSYRLGLEIETAAQVHRNVNLTANLALMESRIKNYRYFLDNWDTGTQTEVINRNAPIAFSPKLVSRQAIEWKPLQNNRQELMLEVSHKYVGAQQLDNSGSPYTRLKPWSTLDTQLSFKVKSSKAQRSVTLWVHGKNLLNKKYFSNGWSYRFMTTDQTVLNNPYTARESNNQFNQVGLFPQATRHYFLGMTLTL